MSWFLTIVATVNNTLPGLLTVLALATPFAVPFWLSGFSKAKLQGLHGALKGAYDALAPIAALTPNKLDDGGVHLLKISADEVQKLIDAMVARAELELGTKLKGKTLAKARFISESLVGRGQRTGQLPPTADKLSDAAKRR